MANPCTVGDACPARKWYTTTTERIAKITKVM